MKNNLLLLSQAVIELDLARTKTSRTQDRIADELEDELSDYLEDIKSMRFEDHKSVEQIKYELGNEIKLLIRLAIEDGFLSGKGYSSKTRRKPITRSDIESIEKITQKTEDRFWNLVVRLEPEIKEFGFELLASYVATLISDAITKSVNVSTISNLSPAFPSPLIIDEPQELIQVQFTTRQDEKVCPICLPLEGSVYTLDNPSKPEIPEDTHPNCRCRYLVLSNGKIISG